MSAVPIEQPPLSILPAAPSSPADCSAIVNRARGEVIASYREFCQKYRPDMNPLEVEVMASSAFDSLLRKGRFSSSNISQIGMQALVKAVSEQLGLYADPVLMADQDARLAGPLSELPHYLTVV